jgi:hypothetical protein
MGSSKQSSQSTWATLNREVKVHEVLQTEQSKYIGSSKQSSLLIAAILYCC